MVKTYLVEEIENGAVVAAHLFHAATPFQAASGACRRTVTLRRGEANWVRVTETVIRAGQDARKVRVFEYYGLGRKAAGAGLPHQSSS
jgi:hypothetical protein